MAKTLGGIRRGWWLGLCLLPFLAEAVEVEGNQRIATSTIQSVFEAATKGATTPEALNTGVRAVLETGHFASVDMRRQAGAGLVLRVSEHPVVGRIGFEGNRAIKKKTLLKQILMRPRDVLTPAKVAMDQDRLMELYRREGRYHVQITPQKVVREGNKVDLVYTIQEGSRARIRMVDFVGNRSFTSYSLSTVIRSHPFAWHRFLSPFSSYQPGTTEVDRELLLRFYRSAGYADVRVDPVQAEYRPELEGFVLRYTIDEGIQYRVEGYRLENHVAEVDTKPLQRLLDGRRVPSVFNGLQLDRLRDRLDRELQLQGIDFVQIDPSFERRPEQGTMVVHYHVRRIPRNYVRTITVEGNDRSRDGMIRKIFRVREGDPWRVYDIRRGRDRLQETDFFETVEIQPQSTEFPDKTDLALTLKDKSTGDISFGVGFSTRDKLMGTVGIQERNVGGTGLDLAYRLHYTKRGLGQEISVSKPYILDTEMTVGIDVLRTHSRADHEQPFRSRTTGVTLRASYDLTDRWSHTVYTSAQKEKLLPRTEGLVPVYLKRSVGEHTKLSVGQRFYYTDIAPFAFPPDGYRMSLDQEYAGFGRDSRYVEHQWSGSRNIGLRQEQVGLELSAKLGYIQGLDKQPLRISDLYTLGGEDLRGFDFGGVGPRFIAKRDMALSSPALQQIYSSDTPALGGKFRYVLRAQLSVPLHALGNNNAMRAFSFVDAGSVLSPQKDRSIPKEWVHHDPSMRVAAGVGLSIASPLGNIHLSYAYPVVKRPYDETRRFLLSMSKNF